MKPLTIAGVEIKAGETHKLNLPLARLYTSDNVSIPVWVKRGKQDGPVVFVSAAIHGDELNGIEIIGRLIKQRALNKLKGTLIAVPFVNGYGVLSQSRYLPDRRDLNRSFPGSPKGSLASRVAHTFFTEIVQKCDYGIDLHTGAIHRSNLPQIRADLDDDETRELAKAFAVPVVLNSDLRDGSLRATACDEGVKILLYEAGQALRFDEVSIKAGVRGIINVLRHLNMLAQSRSQKPPYRPYVAKHSSWVRSSDSGFVIHHKELGAIVNKGDVIATVKNPFGDVIGDMKAPDEGIIIGKQNIPLVQEGEAVYHIGFFKTPEEVYQSFDSMQEAYSN